MLRFCIKTILNGLRPSSLWQYGIIRLVSSSIQTCVSNHNAIGIDSVVAYHLLIWIGKKKKHLRHELINSNRLILKAFLSCIFLYPTFVSKRNFLFLMVYSSNLWIVEKTRSDIFCCSKERFFFVTVYRLKVNMKTIFLFVLDNKRFRFWDNFFFFIMFTECLHPWKRKFLVTHKRKIQYFLGLFVRLYKKSLRYNFRQRIMTGKHFFY